MRVCILISFIFIFSSFTTDDNTAYYPSYSDRNDIILIPSDYKEVFKNEADQEDLSRLKDYIDDKERQLKTYQGYSKDIKQQLDNSHYYLKNNVSIDTLIKNSYVLAVNIKYKNYLDTNFFKLPDNLKTDDVGTTLQPFAYNNTLSVAIQKYQNFLQNIKTLLNKNAIVDNSITNLYSDIRAATSKVQKIYTADDRLNSYKLWISLTFAVIIILLLAFFFGFLMLKSGNDSATDFLKGTGLQFITLFALIISIILFGVLGILEGKELAAILSGISGFILGKGITNNEKKPDVNTPPQTKIV